MMLRPLWARGACADAMWFWVAPKYCMLVVLKGDNLVPSITLHHDSSHGQRHVEASRMQHIPYRRILTDYGVVTSEIIEDSYPGSGTEAHSYILEWIPNDARNPMQLDTRLKWLYTSSDLPGPTRLQSYEPSAFLPRLPSELEWCLSS